MVILVVALILLGPRRLPEMSRKIGKSLAEFKRTSEEFKRTWEREIDLEGIGNESEPTRSLLPSQDSILSSTIERGGIADVPSVSKSADLDKDALVENMPPPSVSPIDPAVMRPDVETASDEPAITTPTRKRDWL